MSGTWQEQLMLLHTRGWTGELIDEACAASTDACSEGDFEVLQASELTPGQARRVLAEAPPDDELRVLCSLAELHDRGDATGDQFRAALRDLDAFADSLGED